MSALQLDKKPGPNPDILILRPDGPLTVGVLPDFVAGTRALTEPVLVLDLEAVPHMDSAGLGAVLNLLSAQQKAGRKLLVAAPSKRVQMLITLTKVDTILPVFPTVDAAVQS